MSSITFTSFLKIGVGVLLQLIVCVFACAQSGSRSLEPANRATKIFTNSIPPQLPWSDPLVGAGGYHRPYVTDWSTIPIDVSGCVFWKATVDTYIVNFNDEVQGGCNFQGFIYLQNRCSEDIEFDLLVELGVSTCNCAIEARSFKPCNAKVIRRHLLLPGNIFEQLVVGEKFHQIAEPGPQAVNVIKKALSSPVPGFPKEVAEIHIKSCYDDPIIGGIRENIDSVFSDVEKIINSQTEAGYWRDYVLNAFTYRRKSIREELGLLCNAVEQGWHVVRAPRCEPVGVCVSCKGTGIERCTQCTEDGYSLLPDGQIEMTIDAKHKVRCPVDLKCHGKYMPCHDCFGNGLNACDNCKFRGTGFNLR